MNVVHDLNIVLNCLAATDGGGSYVRLRTLLEDLQVKAEAGDHDAEEVCTIVNHMAKLVKYSDSLQEVRGNTDA